MRSPYAFKDNSSLHSRGDSLKSMSRYAVRIGSAFALLLIFALSQTPLARADDRQTVVFDGGQFTFTHVLLQPAGEAISIDDAGLGALLDRLGAAATWQPGARYVLVTTAEPVVISFAIGETRYDVGAVTYDAAFAPFVLNGHAYVPLANLLDGLDLLLKHAGAVNVLQPQLAVLDVQNDAVGSKLVAHGGIPLDARIVADSAQKLTVEFDGVAAGPQLTRSLDGGPVRRIEVRTEGSVLKPRSIATLFLLPGTTHGAPSTDDQRDITIAFNAAQSALAAVASAPSDSSPNSPAPGASPSPGTLPSPELSQITGVQTQTRAGSFVIRILVSGNVDYDWHRLRPPDNRWWIDMRAARLAIPPSSAAGANGVSSVRAHQENADTVRVALSLDAFNTVEVVPDSTGVTITVSDTPAATDVSRTGSGTIGESVTAYTQPSGPLVWKYTPRPAATRYAAKNPSLIVIDPGHGGSDAGSLRGAYAEKNYNLDISKRLRDILVTRGWNVIMTRDADRDVYGPFASAHDELQARDDVANLRGARLFVSVHTNAFVNAGPHGATTFYYKPGDVAVAQAISRRIGVEGGIKNDGIVQDKLYVLHHSNMPAALVETAFISNPDDFALLQSAQWRQQMAQAIADGIADYMGPPPGAAARNGH